MAINRQEKSRVLPKPRSPEAPKYANIWIFPCYVMVESAPPFRAGVNRFQPVGLLWFSMCFLSVSGGGALPTEPAKKEADQGFRARQ